MIQATPPPGLIQPGPRNSLADVAGLLVGNAGDLDALTGVTVVLPDRPLLAADVRGGIPGTYHTDALSSGGLMRHVSALVLTGGAAYGIDSIAGLTSWLGARGRGFVGWGAVIPLVCGAVIFDLTNGGNKLWGESPRTVPWRTRRRSRRRLTSRLATPVPALARLPRHSRAALVPPRPMTPSPAPRSRPWSWPILTAR